MATSVLVAVTLGACGARVPPAAEPADKQPAAQQQQGVDPGTLCAPTKTGRGCKIIDTTPSQEFIDKHVECDDSGACWTQPNMGTAPVDPCWDAMRGRPIKSKHCKRAAATLPPPVTVADPP